MALPTTPHTPDVLFDAQGRLLSTVLENHARDFTLLFLHHTIEGTSLNNQHPISGRVIGLAEAPPPILAAAPLTITATPEDVATYGRRHRPSGRPAAPLDVQHHPEDLVERNFVRNHARLTNRGGLKEMVETQRQAMVLAAQRTLDCAARKDQDGFDEAYRQVEAIIHIGIRQIDPELRDAGMQREERQQFLNDMNERALSSAISNRLATMPDAKEKMKLFETYEEYLVTYQETKLQPEQPDGPLRGSEHTPVRESDDPAKYRTTKPFAARVTRGGHDLADGFAADTFPRNDNERGR